MTVMVIPSSVTSVPVGVIVPSCPSVPPVIVGAAAGWWLGSLHGLSTNGRIVLATLAGVYLTIPFTEPLPIATVVGAVARFWPSGKGKGEVLEDEEKEGGGEKQV